MIFKQKIAGQRRPTEIPTKALDPIATGAFGVIQFEKWDNAYWREQKENREFDPEYQAKQNNCRAMDKVEGL